MTYKMEELVPIVAILAKEYTAGESTSITYEKAQHYLLFHELTLLQQDLN